MRFTHSLLFAFMLLALGAQANDQKIGIVDMKTLMTKFWKYPLAQKRMKDKEQEVMAQREQMAKEARDLLRKKEETELSLKGPLLSNEARATKEKELNTIKMLLVQKRKMAMQMDKMQRRKLTQARQVEQKTLVDEITLAIQQHARSEGYTLILDRSQNPLIPSTVLFSAPEKDVTEKILKILNKGHEDKAEKPKEEIPPAKK